MIEMLNALKSYGSLGLFFVIWYIDREFMLKEMDSLTTASKAEIASLKAEIKDGNQKWYDLSRQIDNHILMNVGTMTEGQALQRELKDRIDVLLRRGDK